MSVVNSFAVAKPRASKTDAFNASMKSLWKL